MKCDTDDWSNDVENYHRNKLYVQIYSNRKVILNSNNISQYYCFTVLSIK